MKKISNKKILNDILNKMHGNGGGGVRRIIFFFYPTYRYRGVSRKSPCVVLNSG